MCLPNVTEHIEAGLRRREFLKYAGSAAAAGLFEAGEAIGAPHLHEPDLDLEFAARIRDEEKLASLEELRERIAWDVMEVDKILTSQSKRLTGLQQ